MKSAQSTKTAVALCFALAAAVFIVFGQTSDFGFVNFDDDLYVYKNPTVADGLNWKGVAWVFTHADCSLYHPLTMLSLRANYQFFHLAAPGYHLTNVLLHLGTVLALFLVLRAMTGSDWRAFFAAALFGIHPLRAESVAWISERKDVLAGFLFILTIAAYARWARNLKLQISNLKFYFLALALFVMALLSKPTVITLPVLLLLLDYWPLRRTESLKALVLEKIPFFVLSAAAGVATIMAASQAMATLGHISVQTRVANALVSCATYLRQMVWPSGLAMFFPRPGGHPVWSISLSFLVLTAITVMAFAFGQERRWLRAGWFWYLIALAPMCGLFQVGAFGHADRMTYLPQIGICAALVWSMPEGTTSRLVLGATVVALMVCAWRQTSYWRTSETMWERDIACTGGNYMAYDNLGLDLFERGQADKAIWCYRQSLAGNPPYAEAHNNLGNALLRQGKFGEAIDQFHQALQTNPGFSEAENNLGSALRQAGHLDEALAAYQRAVNLAPENESIHFNFARALFQAKRLNEAIAQYEAAVQLVPNDNEAKNNLALALAMKPDSTLKDRLVAIDLVCQVNLGTGGKNPAILGTLAAALAQSARFEEACQTVSNAIQIAQSENKTKLAKQLQSELQLYQAGRPLRLP